VELHTTAALREAGYRVDEIRRLLGRRALTRLRRGTYVAGAIPDEAAERHRLEVRAATAELSALCVVSHVSAAVLHGLPTWRLPLDRVRVTRHRRSGARRTDRVQVHTAPVEPEELCLAEGLLVTTPARTIVDVARTVPFEQAVVVADAALQAGLIEKPELERALARAAGWPGIPAARHVVAFADGGSESVGESRSRVAIARAGLPAPVLQWEVRTADGAMRATDFAWPQRRTVGEFDGKVKYGRLLRPGEAPGDAVFREKCREDAIRDQGLEVVRWTWADLADFAAVAERIRRRFRT
jgi:hypothetical protein